MGRDVTVRGMTALGIVRARRANELISHSSDEAAMMAVMLEMLRDGVADPALPNNADLIAFARQYPKTARRAFETIKRLTTLE